MGQLFCLLFAAVAAGALSVGLEVGRALLVPPQKCRGVCGALSWFGGGRKYRCLLE
jgi:hypothetical protein